MKLNFLISCSLIPSFLELTYLMPSVLIFSFLSLSFLKLNFLISFCLFDTDVWEVTRPR